MTPLAWVLGRHGLLGRSLRTALAAAGITEFCPPGTLSWSIPEELRVQMADRVSTFAATVSKRVWQIYWAAGTGTMGSSDAQLTNETRALSFLIDCVRYSSLTRTQGTIVFASSAGAIYSGCRDEVIHESTPERAETAYGLSKLSQEKMLNEFAQEFPQIRLQLARITSLYGPHQSSNKPQGLISHIARAVLRRQPIHIFVPFDTIRDYLHVDDAAAAMVRAAMTEENGVSLRILASEQPTTIAQIIGTFRAITRTAPRVITGVHQLGASYPHRMRYQSLRGPCARKPKTLLVGIAEVLAAARMEILLNHRDHQTTKR